MEKVRKNNRISRRRFLEKSVKLSAVAVGFPYIVRSSALGNAGTVSPSNRITLGCIGVGGQGCGNMAAFMSNPDVQIVAVCDVEEKSIYYGQQVRGLEYAKKTVEEKYGKGNCAAYKDFRDLLCRDDIDAVSICPPDHWHGLISIAAAKAGKDIYCEKPLTNTISEGRAVCDAVKSYGRILQTGSHERSNDSARFACELVLNQRIGKLHTIHVNMPNTDAHHKKVKQLDFPQPVMEVPETLDYDFWLGPTPLAPYTHYRSHFWWRFTLDYGGGEMTDRGAHIIDLAQLGNDTDDTGPVELVARGERLTNGLFNTFIDYHFECLYSNGVRMIGTTNEPRGLKFIGDKGWVFIHIHGGRLEAEPKSLLEELICPGEIHTIAIFLIQSKQDNCL
jgi:predicted dehydrogenase